MNDKTRLKLYGFPKIYWVNLSHAGVRRENMEKQFEEYKLRHKRIEGINGTYIENSDKVKYYKGYADILIKKRAQGCAASHILAMKEYLEDESNVEDFCIIAEDDLSFDAVEFWRYRWKEYRNNIPDDYEIIKLCNVNTPDKYEKSLSLFGGELKCLKDEKYDIMYGACIYLIKRSFARKIVDKYYINNIIDFSNGFDIADRVYIYGNFYYYPLFTYGKIVDSYIRNNKNTYDRFNRSREMHFEFLRKVL